MECFSMKRTCIAKRTACARGRKLLRNVRGERRIRSDHVIEMFDLGKRNLDEFPETASWSGAPAWGCWGARHRAWWSGLRWRTRFLWSFLCRSDKERTYPSWFVSAHHDTSRTSNTTETSVTFQPQ